MGDDDVITIYAAYGVTPVRLLPMEKGYRNESHPAVLRDRSRVNLIIYKSEPGILKRIRRSNAVGDFLAAKGFPARRTHDRRIIQITPRKFASLYVYLPGETIPWEAYTMAHLKELGEKMSTMHLLLSEAVPKDLPNVTDEYAEILTRMQRYFAGADVERAMRAKLSLSMRGERLAKLHTILLACKELPTQPLHMDFVRGNILFDGTEITGVIDFEKTCNGHPIFDIARTLAFLLVDCKHKDEDKIRKYFLHSGYNKRGDNTFKIHDNALLEHLTDLFLVHDFYKFLRHNPYEFLHQNEHFVRTRDLLLARALLGA